MKTWCISMYFPLPGAVHVMVLLHRTLWKYCGPVQTATVATGFANFLGNKGGTQVATV